MSSPPDLLQKLADRLSLRLRIFLFFAMLAMGGAAIVAGGLWLGFQRVETSGTASAFLLAGIASVFGLLALVAAIWFLFDEHVGKALTRLASAMRAEAHADAGQPLEGGDARYLGDLAPAARAVSGRLATIRDRLEEAVQEEAARIRRDNARLAAILQDFPAGVLICNADHKIMLYNRLSVELLGAEGPVGLDRSMIELLRPEPLVEALGRISRAGGARSAELLCICASGDRVFQGQIRLLDQIGGQASGYLLVLNDITVGIREHAERDRLIRDFVETVRRPAASLELATELMQGDEPLTGEEAARLRVSSAGESRRLVCIIEDLRERYDRMETTWWPKSAVSAEDLFNGMAARLERAGLQFTSTSAVRHLHCDGYGVILLLSRLAQNIAAGQGGDAFTLEISADEDGLTLALVHDGPVVAIADLDEWLQGRLADAYGDVTLRDIVAVHDTEIWPEPMAGGKARLRMPLENAELAQGADAETALRGDPDYDFDLPGAADGDLMQQPLSSLSFAVFDTETTGLEPDKGDEIVQIAGVRVVNQRVLAKEVFDELVQPGRVIPPSSTRIHGIDDAMVADARPIAEVGASFHRWCGDAVLVAHNAPFDLAFLHRNAPKIGVRFSQPVLDTVLMSAAVFGLTEEHTLDALAGRLGVVIPPELRHTAIGDARATAEVFLKLSKILEERGITTLEDLYAEFRKYRRLLVLEPQGALAG